MLQEARHVMSCGRYGSKNWLTCISRIQNITSHDEFETCMNIFSFSTGLADSVESWISQKANRES